MRMRDVMALAAGVVLGGMIVSGTGTAADAPGMPMPMPMPPVVGGAAMLPAPSLHLDKTAVVGQTVEVRLPSNPTTGYSWAVEAAASEGLDNLGPASESFAMPQDSGNMVGVAGEQIFVFPATHAGQVRAVFVYRRPWAPLADIKTAEVKIVIE